MNTSQPIALMPFQLLYTVLRHWKKVLLFQVAVIALAVAVIVYFPRTYVSESRLLLNIGRETVGLDATATAGNTINFQQSGRRDEMVSALKLLTSRIIFETVVDKVGYDVVLGNAPVPSRDGNQGIEVKENPYTAAVKMAIGRVVGVIKGLDPVGPREEAIIMLEKNLAAKAERDSLLIEIVYEAETPQLARYIVENLSDVFRETHRKAHFNSGSLAFFEDQCATAKEDLHRATEKLRQTKDQMRLASIEGVRQSLEQQGLTLAAERQTTDRTISRLSARIDVIDKQLKTSPERLTSAMTKVPNSGRDVLESQLYAIQMKRLEGANKFQENHPSMQILAGQVEEAEQKMEEVQSFRELETTDINPLSRELTQQLSEARTELSGEQAALKTLDEQLKDLDMKVIFLNKYEKEIDDQKRQVSILIDNYRSYASKLEDARINSELQAERISSVNLIQPATFQEKPSSPNKLLVLLMSAALSFFGTVAIVALGENYRLANRDDFHESYGLGATPARKSASRLTDSKVTKLNVESKENINFDDIRNESTLDSSIDDLSLLK